MTDIKEKISYKEFIAKYKDILDADDQDALETFLRQYIVNTFVNQESKVAEVIKICDLGNHVSIPDLENPGQTKRIFKRDTVTMYYMLKLRLIANYTNIDIKENEWLEAFNALDKLGLIDLLIEFMPEVEIEKWYKMLQMTNDDIYMNERDFAGYLDTKVDAVSIMFDTILSSLSTVMGKLEDKENVN